MAPLKVLCTIGLQGAFIALKPELEKVSGSPLLVEFGVATSFQKEIGAGAAFDLALLTRTIIDELVQGGSLRRESAVDVARSGLGLAVPSSAPIPDISSVKGLMRTLTAARSIASSANGLAGLYFTQVLRELGIADRVEAKLKLETTGGYAAEIAARGEAEIAVQLISEILPVRGVQLAGPFPAAVQRYATLSAGISARSDRQLAAQTLIDLLTSSASDEVLARHGLDPCRGQSR